MKGVYKMLFYFTKVYTVFILKTMKTVKGSIALLNKYNK